MELYRVGLALQQDPTPQTLKAPLLGRVKILIQPTHLVLSEDLPTGAA